MDKNQYGLYERALKTFDRTQFNSGKQKIDDFVKKYAKQQQEKNVSATYILGDADTRLIKGFFTLSPGSVEKSQAPGIKGLPSTVPVTILGWLGIDQKYQSMGLGTELVASALMMAADLCDSGLPTVGVILDVLDDDAAAFYDKLEIFDLVPGQPNKRFVSMLACKALRDKAIE